VTRRAARILRVSAAATYEAAAPLLHHRTVSNPISIEPPARASVHASFVVNGETREAAIAPHKTLLEVLREDLALTGTKHGCELGECGMCTVLLDGEPVLSCLVLAIASMDRAITTVEGLAAGPTLNPLQRAFAELGAAQCGYCTPAMLLTAQALLDRTPHPTRDDMREALSGTLCRCTGYLKIFEAIELAASRRADRDA
jgi:carbon-monoxide dehydrogenase small subunit